MNNGYNKTFVENIIETQLGRFITDNTCKKHGPEQRKFFMRLPSLGDPSNRLLGSINACLNQFKLGSIKVELLHSFSRLEGNFRFKDQQPKHLLNGVVYQVTCSCNLRYIGETKRCLKVRFEEHCKTKGSNMTEIGKHLAESPGHTVSFDDVQILSFEQHFRKRRILESIIIQQSNHTLLKDNLKSVPLYIFNLPQYLITQTT